MSREEALERLVTQLTATRRALLDAAEEYPGIAEEALRRLEDQQLALDPALLESLAQMFSGRGTLVRARTLEEENGSAQ